MSDRLTCNVAVLAGTCSAPSQTRVLGSGATLCRLSLRVPGAAHGPATSVPVTVWDPPAWCRDLDADDEVIVLGRVKRRFWRAGATTASRVEVEAERIARARDRRAVAAIVRKLGDATADIAT